MYEVYDAMETPRARLGQYDTLADAFATLIRGAGSTGYDVSTIDHNSVRLGKSDGSEAFVIVWVPLTVEEHFKALCQEWTKQQNELEGNRRDTPQWLWIGSGRYLEHKQDHYFVYQGSFNNRVTVRGPASSFEALFNLITH